MMTKESWYSKMCINNYNETFIIVQNQLNTGNTLIYLINTISINSTNYSAIILNDMVYFYDIYLQRTTDKVFVDFILYGECFT